MPLTAALVISLALSAGTDRLLLCRPTLSGDPALARPEALLEAGRTLGREVLDYGVSCESTAEAARAAARAGLGRAVWTVAAGAPEGSSYTLVLTTAGEEELARRWLQVPTGADPVAPLAGALRGLRRAGDPPRPAWARPTAWSLLAAGAAGLAVGVVQSSQARDAARRADAATSPGAWLDADRAWKSHRTLSAVALGVGGAALAGGMAVWFVF
jgi:hypothetical protein